MIWCREKQPILVYSNLRIFPVLDHMSRDASYCTPNKFLPAPTNMEDTFFTSLKNDFSIIFL